MTAAISSANLCHVAEHADTLFLMASDTKDLPDTTTVSRSGCYAINGNVTIISRAINFFNNDTIEIWNCDGRPRTFYFGVDAKL